MEVTIDHRGIRIREEGEERSQIAKQRCQMGEKDTICSAGPPVFANLIPDQCSHTQPQQTRPHKCFMKREVYTALGKNQHTYLTVTKAFSTTLYQCHIVMGGLSFAAIGYEVADALERYQRQHDIKGVPSFKQLLQYVESEISIPISLAILEDDSGLTRTLLCCYVDTRIRVYDCEELMAVIVPPQFTRVKEILGIDGGLKRVFTPQGKIISYDANGKTRVKEECVIAVI